MSNPPSGGTSIKFKKLWEVVQGSIAVSQFSATRLREVLDANRSALSDPLQHAPRSAEARREVESLRVRFSGELYTISREFAQQALAVSERLDLSELNSVLLLRDADSRRSLFPDATGIAAIAVQVFFEEFLQFLILTLHSLFSARIAPSAQCSPAVAAVISDFTASLAASGLLSRLVARAAASVDAVCRPSTPAECAAHIAYELDALCQTIFRFLYDILPAPVDVAAILALVRRISSAALSAPAAVRNSLTRAADILTLAFIGLLDPAASLTDPASGVASRGALISDADFARAVAAALRDPWEVPARQAAPCLAFALFIDTAIHGRSPPPADVVALVPALREHADEAWQDLARVAGSTALRTDPQFSELSVAILDRLLGTFLTGFSWSDLQFNFPRGEPARQSHVMRFIAALYGPGTGASQEQALQFWGRLSPDDAAHAAAAARVPEAAESALKLRQFMAFLLDSCSNDTLPDLANCIASLARWPEAALQAWNFVRASANKRFTWEFFFRTFDAYVAQFQAAGAAAARGRQTLSQEDVVGLSAILNLIATLGQASETVRCLFIFDNRPWRALESIFSFLMCPVDHVLKARLAEAIAAFALSPAASSTIWQYLEVSQVLPTTAPAPTPGGPPRPLDGIRFELEEVEAKRNRFPYASAFVLIIQNLLQASPPPDNVGGGQRKAGVLPYVAFVRDSVFLRIESRTFESLRERWELTERCLRVFEQVLARTQFAEPDFAVPGGPGADGGRHKTPAYELMCDFLGHGRVLRPILDVLVQAAERLEADKPGDHCDAFEQSALLSLKIIDAVFAREEDFSRREAAASIPRMEKAAFHESLTRSKQHVVSVAQLVGYQYSHGVALYAARALYNLSTRTPVVAQYLAEPAVHLRVIAAVVACLQNDEQANDAADEATSAETARWVVVKTLVDNLGKPRPNLTQALLAFNPATVAPGAQFDFQSASIVTPLQVVLELLEGQAVLFQRDPMLCEVCYEFIFSLLSDGQMREPVVNLLRSSPHEFFLRGVAAMPPVLHQSPAVRAAQLMSFSWFLRAVAVDIRHASLLGQRSHLQKVIPALFSPEREREREGSDEAGFALDDRSKIIQFFDSLNVAIPDVKPVQSGNFAAADVKSCVRLNRRGVAVTLIGRLREELLREKGRLERSGAGAPDSTELGAQMRRILYGAVQFNEAQNLRGALHAASEGWRQVVEVTLYGAFQYLSAETREDTVYELAENVLRRAAARDTQDSVAQGLAQTVVALVSKLHANKSLHDFVNSTGSLPAVARTTDAIRRIADCIRRTPSEAVMRGNLYAALFSFLQCSHRPPAYLTALAEAGDGPAASAEPERLARLEEVRRQQAALEEAIGDTVYDLGSDLFDLIWQDLLAESVLCQSVAPCALQALHRFDARRGGTGITAMARRGHVKHLLEAVVQSLSEPSAMFGAAAAVPDPAATTLELRQFFIYESRMSLLCTIAQDPNGASLLCQNDVVGHLLQCRSLATDPGISAAAAGAASASSVFSAAYGLQDPMAPLDAAWTGTAQHRYERAMVPLLRLVGSLLASLPDNAPLAAQAASFVSTFAPAFRSILPGGGALTLDRLRLIGTATTVFRLLAGHQSVAAALETTQGLVSPLVGLLARFCTPKLWESRVIAAIDELDVAVADDDGDGKRVRAQVLHDARAIVARICTDVVLFCRRMNGSLEIASDGGTFFSCDASEVWAGPPAQRQQHKKPPIGVVTAFLRWALSYRYFLVQGEQARSAECAHISESVRPRLESLVANSGELQLVQELEPARRQQLARLALYQEIEMIHATVSTLTCAIENSLFVLLRHVEFFRKNTASKSLVPSQMTEAMLRGTETALQDLRGEQSSILQRLPEVEQATRPNVIQHFIRSLLKLLPASTATPQK